jgi:hypothetical protein
MSVAYPANLPTVLATKRVSKGAAFSVANPRRGTPYIEPTGTDTPTVFDVEWRLTESDAAALVEWFEDALSRGTAEFTIPLRTETGLRAITANFMTGLSESKTRDGALWTYRATIVSRTGTGPLFVPVPPPPTVIAFAFPTLVSTDPGYPIVGELHPFSLNVPALGYAARIQIASTIGSFADDRFVVNGVDRWTALPTLEPLRAGRTVVDYLEPTIPLQVNLRNLLNSQSGGQIAVLVTPLTAPTAQDANRASVALHARAGFVDGSANIFDDTVRGVRSVIGAGTVVSESVALWPGETSISFAGGASDVSFDSNAAFDMGAGDWTIQTFVRRTNMTAEVVPFARLSPSGSASGVAFFMQASGAAYAGAWANGGALIAGVSIPAGTFTAGQWYYIAWRRNGSSFQVAVGTTPGSATTVYGATGTGTVGGTTHPFTLGRDPGAVPKRLVGHMTELLFTAGLALDISTVPTAPFARR